MNLQDGVAVVTGAGGGLGHALAAACARRGMKLVLADVDADGLATSAAKLAEEHPGLLLASRRTDVTRAEEWDALAALCEERFGGADILFNNAGVAVAAPLWENSAADWQWLIGVNLLGVGYGIKAFVPAMVKKGRGHVVNVASAAGWAYPPGMGIYNATKAAVVALSESLANDLLVAQSPVGVSVLSPAFFPTGIAASERVRPAELANPAKASPLKRKYEERIRDAVAGATLSAAEVAEITVKGVEEGRFYLFPHGWVPDAAAVRAKVVGEGMTAFCPKL
jgi:NAD(P)-dependent dehydrogenase (short-subunit alcohol dehydrogenase family)